MTEFRISLLLKSFKYYFLVKETEELLMLKKNKKKTTIIYKFKASPTTSPHPFSRASHTFQTGHDSRS